MKRMRFLAPLLILPAVAMFFIVGCPDPAKDKNKPKDAVTADADKNKDKDKDKDKGKGGTVEITTQTDGTIKGVVKYDGTPPEAKPLDVGDHKDKKTCLAGTGIHVVDQTWLVKDGNVANVVISLGPPAGKKFKITPELKKPFETTTVFMDQPFCTYVPHVAAVYADIQDFVVKNSAAISHDVTISGNKNALSNTNLPAKSGETVKQTEPRKFEMESGPINVTCNIHKGFMTAKVLTFNNPYFAVTDENGAFEIKNVPVTEEITIFMWHESMSGGRGEAKKLTLKAGETQSVELKISAPKK